MEISSATKPLKFTADIHENKAYSTYKISRPLMTGCPTVVQRALNRAPSFYIGSDNKNLYQKQGEDRGQLLGGKHIWGRRPLWCCEIAKEADSSLRKYFKNRRNSYNKSKQLTSYIIRLIIYLSVAT